MSTSTFKRSPQRQVEINILAEKLLNGATRKELEAVVINEFGKSKGSAREYIAEAGKRVEELFNERFESRLPFIATNFQKVYEEAMAVKDFKGANEALKNLATLLGMMKTKVESKTEISTSGELKDVPTDELIKIVKQGG